VAYQPVVRISDGAVAVAEQSGLILEIGAWVLERSCRDWVRWHAGHADLALDLSVNVSARQLMGPGFCSTVGLVLDVTKMDPGSLVLEVTEGIFVEDGDRAMTVLANLKALGVRLALDDFGTGYCSLGYLRKFPVDIVKIDQGFVAGIGRDPAAATIVAAVTSLAHVLHMRVTAEGVETERQRDEVLGIGCELAQGFFYSQPLSGTDFARHLDACEGGPILLPATGRAPSERLSAAALGSA